MASFISHPKTFLPTAHVKKRNNYKMASQLKFNKFHTDAKKLQLLPVWLFMQQTYIKLKSTCEFTVERNRSLVHHATTLALKLAILKSTCESIEEKGLMVARSATIPRILRDNFTLISCYPARVHSTPVRRASLRSMQVLLRADRVPERGQVKIFRKMGSGC